jgi:HSP20 family protein
MAATTRNERSCETPVDKLRQEFEKLLETVWSQGERAADMMGLRQPGRNWMPPADIVETHDAVLVRLDLPGVDPDTLDVILTGNMLTVKGHRLLEEVKTEDVAHRRERPAGIFSRAIPLPCSVDCDRVAAESKNGVLTITISKVESEKTRHIKVHVKKGATLHPEVT